jgi:uncharacterized membrane protein
MADTTTGSAAQGMPNACGRSGNSRHSLLSYVFGTSILATTVNLVAGIVTG